MARIIDDSKLISIKKATIDVVVKDGIKNASVSKIAEEAGVSSGYLYRFHKSKEELIQAIFDELFARIANLFSNLIREENSVKTIINKFLISLFKDCDTHPNNALFILKLMTDYSFKMNETEKQTLNTISEKILLLGHTTKEIRENINKELLYTLVVGTTYFFINMRQREVFNTHTLNNEDIEKITELYTKALA